VGQVLNCVWVLLSLGAFVRWLWLSSRERPARRLPLCGLICALTLLYPVISDNDDLIQQEPLSVPASPVLKSLFQAKAVCENGTTPVESAHAALFVGWVTQGLVSNEPRAFVSTTLSGATGDRSPPQVS
jgi:hypothetical protein